MAYLFLKYYFRNSLWVNYYPVIYIVLELVIPVQLTVLPFFFIQHCFLLSNYFTPLNEKIIQYTNFSNLKAVQLNNVINLTTALFCFVLIESILACVQVLFFKEVAFNFSYDFLPLIIWSIALGNLYVYFFYKFPRVAVWFLSVAYKAFSSVIIFCIFLIVYNSNQILFLQVFAFGLSIIALSYLLINKIA